MKKRTLRITAAIATIAVAASAAAALAGQRTLDRAKRHAPRTFTVSGTYSGSFEGNMYVGGHKIAVTKKTVIHSTREGTLEYGSSAANRPVYVTGVVERGEMRATMIVVRDDRSSGPKKAGELPADAPR
jgi:hypothetical protein